MLLSFVTLSIALCSSGALQQHTSPKQPKSAAVVRGSNLRASSGDYLSELGQAQLPDFSQWRSAKESVVVEDEESVSTIAPPPEYAAATRLVTRNMETIPMMTHKDEEDRIRQEEETRRIEYMNQLKDDEMAFCDEREKERESQFNHQLRSHHEKNVGQENGGLRSHHYENVVRSHHHENVGNKENNGPDYLERARQEEEARIRAMEYERAQAFQGQKGVDDPVVREIPQARVDQYQELSHDYPVVREMTQYQEEPSPDYSVVRREIPQARADQNQELYRPNEQWTFPRPEMELLSRSKDFFETLNQINHKHGPDNIERVAVLLSPDFTFVSTDTDECMSKNHYLSFQKKVWQSFITPSFDIDANYYGYSADPMHQGRVWCFCRLKMTQKADFFGAKRVERGKPTILHFPPQVHTLDFDPRTGLIARYGCYTTADEDGIIGTGGVYGVQRAMNERVPLAEARPYRRANASFKAKANVFFMNHVLSKFKRNDHSDDAPRNDGQYDNRGIGQFQKYHDDDELSRENSSSRINPDATPVQESGTIRNTQSIIGEPYKSPNYGAGYTHQLESGSNRHEEEENNNKNMAEGNEQLKKNYSPWKSSGLGSSYMDQLSSNVKSESRESYMQNAAAVSSTGNENGENTSETKSKQQNERTDFRTSSDYSRTNDDSNWQKTSNWRSNDNALWTTDTDTFEGKISKREGENSDWSSTGFGRNSELRASDGSGWQGASDWSSNANDFERNGNDMNGDWRYERSKQGNEGGKWGSSQGAKNANMNDWSNGGSNLNHQTDHCNFIGNREGNTGWRNDANAGYDSVPRDARGGRDEPHIRSHHDYPKNERMYGSIGEDRSNGSGWGENFDPSYNQNHRQW